MKVVKCGQPNWGPADKPKVVDPVVATLDVPVYYITERGPVLQTHGMLCSRQFAAVVLKPAEEWAKGHGFAVCHVGVYNPRMARSRTGKPIMPARWSNHAWAEAWDFKGIITDSGRGKYLGVAEMKIGCPAKLWSLVSACRRLIAAIERAAEIVDEGGWVHMGMHPVKSG